MHWRFGRFQLDCENACLWEGEQRLTLRPKTFDLLVYLVAHAGELVRKETLLQAVWPDTVVADGVLTTSMGELVWSADLDILCDWPGLPHISGSHPFAGKEEECAEIVELWEMRCTVPAALAQTAEPCRAVPDSRPLRHGAC